jgi:acetyl-CoA carboxylase carboxyl transferase subunit alpha
MLENSTYSVISPEGAAALLWKDSNLAQKAAESMKITAYDLNQLGVVDQVIPEPKGGAHRDVKKQAENIDEVLQQSLQVLTTLTTDELVERRWEKYKQMGAYKESK